MITVKFNPKAAFCIEFTYCDTSTTTTCYLAPSEAKELKAALEDALAQLAAHPDSRIWIEAEEDEDLPY